MSMVRIRLRIYDDRETLEELKSKFEEETFLAFIDCPPELKDTTFDDVSIDSMFYVLTSSISFDDITELIVNDKIEGFKKKVWLYMKYGCFDKNEWLFKTLGCRVDMYDVTVKDHGSYIKVMFCAEADIDKFIELLTKKYNIRRISYAKEIIGDR